MEQFKDSLLKIAKVSKSDGTDGAVVISFLSMDPEDLDISEPVFVHFDGLPVPFFIESFTRRGNSRAVVRLNDVRSFEDAEELVGKDVYVEDDGEDVDDGDLVGWTIEVAGQHDGPDAKKKGLRSSVLGKVTEFLDIPSNPCLEVETEKGAVVVPLHEDFIVSVNQEKQIIVMNLPDGLV